MVTLWKPELTGERCEVDRHVQTAEAWDRGVGPGSAKWLGMACLCGEMGWDYVNAPSTGGLPYFAGGWVRRTEMSETKAQAEARADLKAEIKELKADAKEAQADARADAREKKADAKEAISSAGHALIIEAIREIESTVAAQWANEKFNDGARAAAQVLRAKVGLRPDEPLPVEAP